MNNIDVGDASVDALAILQAQLSGRSKFIVAIESTLFLLLDLAAFVGNALVCYIMYRNPQLRTPTNLYILWLAITDLIIAVLVLPFTVASHINSGWIFGSVMCRVQGYLLTVLLQISIYMMTLTAINRYLCINKPNLYKVYFTKKRTFLSIVIVWVITMVINAVPDVLSLNDDTFFCPGYVLCWKRVSNPVAIYIMFIWLYLTFAAAYTTIVVCYYRIFKAVNHHKKAVADTLHQPQVFAEMYPRPNGQRYCMIYDCLIAHDEMFLQGALTDPTVPVYSLRGFTFKSKNTMRIEECNSMIDGS